VGPPRRALAGTPLLQCRTSASGFGSGLNRVVEAGLYLPPPFGDLLLEHSDQAAGLIEFGAHTIEFRLQAIQFPISRNFLILHALLYDRDILELLRL
jgi:hypothetical protein